MKEQQALERSVNDAVSAITSRIESGQYANGSKMPSVRNLARELGVSPNTITAALGVLESDRLIERRPRSGVFVKREGFFDESKPIGIVIPEWLSELKAGDLVYELFAECKRVFTANQLSVEPITIDTRNSEMTTIAKITQALENSDLEFGAILVIGSSLIESELEALVGELNIPILTFSRYDDSSIHNFITFNYAKAGRLIAEKCKRRIQSGELLVLDGHIENSYSSQRLIGGLINATQVMRIPEMTYRSLALKESSIESGYEAMQAYLSSNQPPAVVLSLGELLIIGAVRAIKEAGLRIPKDIAVVGTAGLEATNQVKPLLASILQPQCDLVENALAFLRNCSRERSLWRRGIKIDVSWREGKSI